MKKIILLLLILFSISAYGRTYSEYEEWKSKNLPWTIRRSVQVEINDFLSEPGTGYDYPGIRLRVHNRGNLMVEELVVSVWFWKKDGVYVREMILVDRNGSWNERLLPGEERYMPGEKRYYYFENLKFDEIERLDIKIKRVTTRRAFR